MYLLIKLYPALWVGMEQAVIRATWFYVSADCTVSPIAWDSAIANDLDAAYERIEPWSLSQRLRALSTEVRQTPTMHDLPSVFGGARVAFDNAYTGRIYMCVMADQNQHWRRDPLVSP